MTVLEPGLERLLRIALVRAEPIRSGPAAPELRDAIERAAAAARAAYAGLAPAEIAGLGPARRLYRAFGIDPTRTRPSSEALLRRVLRGGTVPEIAAPVDVSNLLALRFLLPNGLYDADRLHGLVTIRRGREGESYAGIRKGEVHVAGRPVVADELGAFGNPTSDSDRTSVSAATRRLLVVVFAPADYDTVRLADHLAEARDTVARHLAPPGATVSTEGELLGRRSGATPDAPQ